MTSNFGLRDDSRFNKLEPEVAKKAIYQADFCAKVLKLRPCMDATLRQLALLLTELGYYHAALELDSRLVQLFPDDMVVHYNYACSLALTRQFNPALKHLEHSIDLGYNCLNDIRNDVDLAGLRSMPEFEQLLNKKEQEFIDNDIESLPDLPYESTSLDDIDLPAPEDDKG